MSVRLGSEQFERLLSDTMRTLSQVDRDGAPDRAEAGAGPVTAEAADGLVRATVNREGQVEEIQADPRLLRSGLEPLLAHVATAVNAALAQAAPPPPAPPQIDFGELSDQLREVQQSAVPRMESFLRTLAETQERLAARSQR